MTMYNRKHGMYKSKEYKSWIKMRERCRDSNNNRYHLYGGRGIEVCDRWLNSFENFFEDMGLKPTPKHQIDRIDNHSDYTPENCRWASTKENNNNRSISKYQFIHGARYDSCEDAAKALGVVHTAIIAWCDGVKKGKYYYPPKDGCYSELKYPIPNTHSEAD